MRTETYNPFPSRRPALRMSRRGGPSTGRRPCAGPRFPLMPAIPGSFDADQGLLILELRTLARRAPADDAAAAALRSMGMFSAAQLVCIGQLLRLERADFLATLGDSLEACELRDRLRASSFHPLSRLVAEDA
jgi:hypothetical protein